MSKNYLPVLTMLGGGALVYYLYSLRDTTPVGLTIVKKLENDAITANAEKVYSYEIIDGTYRESEGSLPLKSNDNNAVLALYDPDGDIIYAENIKKDSILLQNPSDYEEILSLAKEQRRIVKNVESNVDALDEVIASLEESIAEETTSQNAEMILRPTTTLQSHFVW